MGRIADAAFAILHRGPAHLEDVAAELKAQGVTRAQDPVGAVRRALRDDVRVLDLPDGRLAAISQALNAMELTTIVTPRDIRAGYVDLESDLSPLIMIGVGLELELPGDVAAGDMLAVRVDDADAARITMRVIPHAPRRPDDEAALLDMVGHLLRQAPAQPGWVTPPAVHLATAVVAVAADRGDLLRAPARPVAEVLQAAGFEVHLGWVGYGGTDWGVVTETEAQMVEGEVARLLMLERPGEAADLQERLLELLSEHLPDRVPPARRRLARALARSGRTEDALAALVTADAGPEDWYEAVVIAARDGDDVRARRWVESGLARVAGERDADAAACLADVGGDLDAQAAFLRARQELAVLSPDADGARALVDAVACIRRSYLLEVFVEELLGTMSSPDLVALVDHLGDCGDLGRDACQAIAAVAGEPIARRARAVAGGYGRAARLRCVAGLVDAHAVGAWSTLFEDAPDQRQIIITVAKEDERVSVLIVLFDFADLDGAVKDAFFLPDMIEERLMREVIAPMEELGLRCRPIPVESASSLLAEGLALTDEIGWRMPSQDAQPVRERIERQVLSGDPSSNRG